jgi:hypothetical protein
MFGSRSRLRAGFTLEIQTSVAHTARIESFALEKRTDEASLVEL